MKRWQVNLQVFDEFMCVPTNLHVYIQLKLKFMQKSCTLSDNLYIRNSHLEETCTSVGQHTQNQICDFSSSNSASLYGTVLSEWPHYHPVSQASILVPVLIFNFLTFLTGHTQPLLKHLLNIFMSQFSLLILSFLLIFFGYFSACLTGILWQLRW